MSFDKVILPGEEGKIKVKVATNGWGGKKIAKSIRVKTNDPNHAMMELKISGDVKEFAVIIPNLVYLHGKMGEKLSQTVKIIPATEDPFRIMIVRTSSGANIRYSLSQIEESGKNLYELTIENIKETPGQYDDTISLTTNRSEQTPLIVPIKGDIVSQSEALFEGGENAAQQATPESNAPEDKKRP